MLVKRSIVVAAICLSLTVYTAAQNSNLDTSYARWKSEALKQNPEIPHIALTLAAARSELGSVRVDALGSGKAIGLKLQLETGRIEDTSNQKIFVPVGEKFTGSQKLRESDGSSAGPSRLTMTVPASEDSDVIRVTWFISVNGSEKSLQILIPVSSEHEASTVGIVQNSDLAKVAAPLCPLICYEVSGSNERCGFFYKCCAELSGNNINFTTCTVTCGTACPV